MPEDNPIIGVSARDRGADVNATRGRKWKAHWIPVKKSRRDCSATLIVPAPFILSVLIGAEKKQSIGRSIFNRSIIKHSQFGRMNFNF